MDSYKVIISPKALAQLNSYVDYVQYTLRNKQAARSIWQDAVRTRELLSNIAASLSFCTHPQLRKLGYRMISFQKHRYIMLYRVDGRIAYVDAIYHQLQDYENIFVRDLETPY